MTEKTLGYVHLVWTCPNCNTKNPGPQKTCISCGSPQPADVQFEQDQQQELITDQKEIEQAQRGPDIHCPYCGARNVADATICVQCGGDLKEGLRREAGRVVGAYEKDKKPVQMIPCPNCNTPNPETNTNCTACGANLHPAAKPLPVPPPVPVKKAGGFSAIGIGLGVLIGLGALCLIIVLVMTFSRKESLVGRVQSVNWTRTIQIEGLREVTYQTWKDELPQNATPGTCEKKYHHTQVESEPGAEEVCGTPYTKDTGGGFGQVVQDCEYKIYQDYCSYKVKEWQVVDQVALKGSDLNPRWPQPNLGQGQRAGDQEERYVIVLSTDKGEYTYSTSDAALFARCQPGSEWTLVINAFNQVTSIEPK